MGDRIDLSEPQALTAPAATWFELTGWFTNLSEKTITAYYVWHTADGVIPVNGKLEQEAVFRNIEDDPATPENEQDRQYAAIYRYDIVAGDVGKKVGRLFKQKLLDKLAARILAAGITITDPEV